MRKVRVMCGAAMLAACLTPAAHADEWTKLTYFTFSGPVEMPGIVLPAGTYKFELADPDSSRRVVRVSDKEGDKIHVIFLSISDQKMEPSDKPLVMFMEAAAGAPEAVKAWFYPGETQGYEFVYPHDQALKIAKAVHSTVLTAKGAVTGTTQASDTTRIDENDRVMTAESTTASAAAARQTPQPPETTTAATSPVPPAAPAPEPAPTTTATTAAPAPTSAQAVQAPATVAPQPMTTPRGTTITEPAAVGTSGELGAPATKSSRGHLPGTASLLPLMELLSGLSIAGGFGCRALRRRLG